MFRLKQSTFDLDYENVFLDLDGTLVHKKTGKVEPLIIAFAYKALINDKKNIFLITKHPGSEFDLRTDLFAHKLDSLFQMDKNVYHLTQQDEKWKYIEKIPGKSILIDNQLNEQAQAQAHGIPAFSVEQIEMDMKG